MTRPFQKEIDRLKRRVLQLTAIVEDNLRASVRSVIERDVDLADRVVEEDNEIDQMEVELEEECLKILALHQPVAIDLRFVIATLKINNDLERIGDLAVNIAKLLPKLLPVSERKVPFDLTAMLQLALSMVQRSADSLVDLDVDGARAVCESDDELDNMHYDARDALEQEIQRNPDLTGYYLSLLLISRNLERIGDHATNIAEDVIYMVEGEIIRHRGKTSARQ